MKHADMINSTADFPTNFIDPEAYSARYSDARERMRKRITRDTLDDYIRFGAKDGLNPCAWFEEHWYVRRYPDAAEAAQTGRVISGFHFYLTVGRFRGDDPSPRFSEKRYLAINLDVRAAVREARRNQSGNGLSCGLEHWLIYGQKEGRDLGLGHVNGEPLRLNVG